MVQTAHAFYRGQHNKTLKLEHCWEILNKCQPFMRFMVSLPSTDSASYVTPPRRPSHSATVLQETNSSGAAAHGEDELTETPLNEGTNLAARSNNDAPVDDVADEHQSPPFRARPTGKKAAKRAKRQASMEAQSSLGERIALSLEAMTSSNNVGWNKATVLHERELNATMRNKKIQAIIGRIVIEKELINCDKIMLDVDPTVFGSPSEKLRIFVERRSKLAELQAQADALMTIGIHAGGDSATGDTANLSSRFDEVGSG